MASSVVHSRAYLLIEQELLKIESNPVKGIRVYPTRAGNLFSLSAKIKGLPDTLWEGGILKLRLRFSESYSFVPPEANFVTVPFHPNVEPDTGRVASPYLDDPQKWNAAVSLADLLASIQRQLTEPNPHLVLNPEADDMMRNDLEQYKNVVAQCVQMSQIVENSPDKLRPFSASGDDELEDEFASRGLRRPVEIEYHPDYLAKPAPRPKPSQRRISFETYHADWSRLATSKTIDREPFNPASVWHTADSLSAKMEGHRRLKYGNSGKPQQQQQQQEKLESNLERLDQMRRLYIAQRHASNVSTNRSLMSDVKRPPPAQQHHQQQHQIDDEAEAEDLVQWTRGLPTDDALKAKA